MSKPVRKKAKPAKAAVPKTPVSEISPEQQIVGAVLLGKARSYDASARAVVLVLEAPLAVGESIRVKGRVTDLQQRVERVAVAGQSVQSAMAGETAAVSVADRVEAGDAVYKL